ncbi:hypothetical protein [Marinobacter flavimaris]|jgi:hypothetical protein|nr:hypothetical protein [Marinobacter flavimaris]
MEKVKRGQTVRLGRVLAKVKRVYKNTLVIETRGGRLRVAREGVDMAWGA